MGFLNISTEELEKLVIEKKFTELKKHLLEMMPEDIADLMEEVSKPEALIIYRLLPKDLAVEVFAEIEVDRQSELTALVSENELKDIVEELFFDDMIDLIEELPANIVKKILKNATNQERKLINQFLNYPVDSAGSIMTIEFVELKKEMTIIEAMTKIKQTGVNKETIYTCYVTSHNKLLEGIISLKDLVLSPDNSRLEDIMLGDFINVGTHDDQEIVAEVFKKYDLLSLPVVDHENRLVGIITIDDVVDVIEEETTEDFQKMAGTIPSDEEYMSMSPLNLAKKRIFWLTILMFSATISQIVTNKNSALTAQFTILVGVMPMLMSTGGNAGAQSSTLVIRGLTLGEICFADFFKVMWKEIRVGLIVGISLGIMNFIRILIFNNDIKLAAIVGLTLIGTTSVAALMGGILPIVAKRLKLDPAIMASPLITTITDATTLLIFFGIATYFLLTVS